MKEMAVRPRSVAAGPILKVYKKTDEGYYPCKQITLHGWIDGEPGKQSGLRSMAVFFIVPMGNVRQRAHVSAIRIVGICLQVFGKTKRVRTKRRRDEEVSHAGMQEK